MRITSTPLPTDPHQASVFLAGRIGRVMKLIEQTRTSIIADQGFKDSELAAQHAAYFALLGQFIKARARG